jgi:homoserine kinase
LAVCWSGAGPSLLGITHGTEAHAVQAAAIAALEQADVPGQVMILHADMHGLILDRTGSSDLFDFSADE